MKKLIPALPKAFWNVAFYLFSTFLVNSTFGQTGWTLFNPASSVIRDVEQVQITTGPNTYQIFAVGDNGLVQKVNAEGGAWTVINTGVNTNLKAFASADKFTFWAAGEDKVIRTTNSGSSWSSTTIAGLPSLNSISMVDFNVGWVVGSSGKIFKTTNGGVTWTAQTSNTTNTLYKILAQGQSDAIAVGANGTICRTSNGGTTWAVSTLGDGTKDLYSITATNNELYASGEGGTIIKSIDGGNAWGAQTSGTTSNLLDIASYDVAGGKGFYACGNVGALVRSTNGTAWATVATGRTDNFITIANIPSSPYNFYLATSTKGFLSTYGFASCVAPTTAMVSSNITACLGDDITITTTSTGAIATRSLKKDGVVVNVNGNTTALGNVITLTNVQPSQTGTYLVEVTSPCGNASTTSITVTVNDVPTPVFTILGSGYPTQTIENPYSVNQIAGLSYEWDGGSGAAITGSGNAVNITWASTGARTVSVTPSNSCGSGIASTKAVTVQVPLAAPTLSPLDNAASVPVASNITLTFGTSLTLTSGKTITIKRSSDNSVFAAYTIPSGNVTVSSNVVTINPTTNFESSTAYYVQIDPGTFYNQLSPFNAYLGITSPTGWNFTSADVTPPTVTNYSPAISATGVAVGSDLVATFSENVFAVATKVIGIQRVSNNAVFATYTLPSPNVTITGNTVTINPSTDLATSTAYYINMPTGAFEDASGNDMTGGTSWAFTTAAPVITPPTIATLSPGDDAVAVPVNANLVATFSENITAVATRPIYIYRTSDNAIFGNYTLPSANVTVSGNTVTINPSSDLAPSTGYYLIIGAGAFEDAAGDDFAGILDNSTWNFTTAAPPTPPTILSLSPADNGIDVAVNSNLSATFSENVSAVSSKVVSIKRLSDNALFESYVLPSGNITISGAMVTINPTGSLENATSYYVTMDAGSFEDAAGDDIVGFNDNSTWNFTTLSAAPQNQTITFNALAAKNFGDAAFALTATASSGLMVSYSSSNTSVATISGSTVNIVGAGSTTVTASQAGNGSFNAAPDVQQALTVNKANQTIAFGALAAKTFGDPNFTLGATASSSLPVSYTSSNTLVATVSGNTVTIVGAGSTIITASQAGNANFNAATDVQQTLTINKANQAITFGALAAKTLGDASFALDASASSGLGVSYSSSNTAVATVSGNTVTIVGAGSTVITASQTGNANFNAATDVQQTLTVNKASQTITFGALVTKTFGDANFALGATASSILPVSYTSSNTAVATVSGSTVTIVGTGSATITASQAGNTNYNAAANVQQTLTVNKANQTITFGTLVGKQVGDEAFGLTATSTSGLVVTYSSSNAAVATVSGSTVTIVGAGSTTITASQAGNANFNSAANVQQIFTVTNATPAMAIQFLTPSDNATGVDGSIDLSITFNQNVDIGAGTISILRSDNDALVTSLSNFSNAITISGPTVTFNFPANVPAGISVYVNISAAYFRSAADGSNTFAGISDKTTWSFTTGKLDQTITFNALADKTFGEAAFALTATASSGLAVSYSSSNTAVATVSGNTVTIVGAGSATMTASQVGNTNFNAATNVQQTLIVNKASQAITFGALAAKTFGDAAFTLSATASSGLGVSYSSSNTAVATVSGNTVTIVGAGSATMTASQVGNTNFNAATNVQQTLIVNKASQAITFGALAAKTFGDADFTVNATASSGLGVSYSSSNTAVATVSGNTVTIVGAGSATITASQVGNTNFNAATNVQQTLNVNKANQAITFGTLAAKTFGDADFTLSATASSGLGVSYSSSNTAVATVSGNTVTIVGAGSTTITASQAGNENFNAATNVQQTLTVNKANQTITFGALPGKQVGDAAFGLTATASSGLGVGYVSSNTSVATVSGTTITIVSVGSTTITASQAGNANFNAATNVQQTLTVTNTAPVMAIQSLTPTDNATGVDGSIDLSITFNQNVSIGAGTISILRSDIDAVVTSLSNFPSAITISGPTVTFNFSANVPAGTSVYVNISAGYFRSASDGSNTFAGISDKTTWNFTTGKLVQTITFNALAAKTFGDAAFALTATASSGLAVSYSSSNTAVATVSGSTVTLVGVGSSTITASQAGNGSFNAAANVQQTLNVSKASQAITFGALAAKTFGDADFTLSATASSGLGVNYTSSNTSVATVSGNTVTIIAAGSTIITASQAGNSNYNASTNVQQTLTVNKADQTITFGALATKTFGDANFTLSAAASSGLGVSYTSSNTSVATVSGNTVTIVGAGSTTITASQGGSTNINSAPIVQQALTVNKANQTITFSDIPDKTVGDAAFGLTASASSGLPVTFSSSNTAVATVSGNTITIVAAGSTTITASQNGNTNFNTAATVDRTLVVSNPAKQNQTITFNTLSAKTFGDANFTLSATASSGLAISYSSSNTAVATISGSTVTIAGVGSTVITASQAGNGSFNPAPSVQQTLTVNKANQIITFNPLAVKTFGDASFTLNATSSSTLTITYTSSNTSVATVSGSIVTIVGAGTTTITATQGGDAFYNLATPVAQSLTVNKAEQTIMFEPLVARGIGAPPFSLEATATSGLAISYTSSNTAVATIVGSTVTIVGPGTTTITASQAGNANYHAATSIGQSLTVKAKQNQNITFDALSAKTFGDAAFALTATATSGLPVTFASSNTSVATVNGNTLTIVGAGTTSITASQSGNDVYSPATAVGRSLVVNKADQTISFNALPAQQLSAGNIQLTATASSGLAVSFASSDPGVATVSGTTVHFLIAGTTTITASQPGSNNFNPATNVSQILTIAEKQAQTITFATLSEKKYGDAAFHLSASSSSSLPVSYISSNTSVATINGSTVTIVGAGSSVIKASQAGNSQVSAATDVEQTLVVRKAGQVIAFDPLPDRGLSQGAFNLAATSSSGLPITYTSSNVAVVTVSGNTATLAGTGSVTLRASQAGNGNFEAAVSVSRSLFILDDTPTRIINADDALKFGDIIIPETAKKTFTITNSGNDKLAISAITFPEGYTGDKTSGSIAAGGSLVVTVTFSPTQAKEYSGNIVITSNATSGNGSLVAVTGKGTTITAIGDMSDVKSMTAFPNPGRGIYTLTVKQPQSQQALVIDDAGRVTGYAELQPAGDGQYKVDITSMAQGVYFLKLPADQHVKAIRVIKID